ncbi:universal stress protein [Hymenobacter rubripertinctus]|uniref:Universal stress protein n=1 Tax=Hymenobacter rubripertinctus TaxID=2029981 RepID=A0A418QND9_9BACT|nr:universal stress protein [Hymenobacter rubripertinctus]RIY06632.1 universal stress protein [Hymenobacter rubripertinctus]
MKNILVPTDFSPEAHYAFEAALQLARRSRGHITLLHVVDLPPVAHMATSGSQVGDDGLNNVFVLKVLQATKRRLHALMAEGQQLAPGVVVTELVLTTEFEAAVLEAIHDQHIDLVVMGAHEHTSWTRFFLNSNTERVMRVAPCPVLTVKHPVADFDVRHLVFASDFAAEADLAVPGLHQLQALFPEATLHLLDVVPSADRHDQALTAIHEFADRHHLPHYEPEVFDAPQASTGIPRFAEQAHADLVVMLTHGRSALSHLFQASISETVALHANPPVLTLHV